MSILALTDIFPDKLATDKITDLQLRLQRVPRQGTSFFSSSLPSYLGRELGPETAPADTDGDGV